MIIYIHNIQWTLAIHFFAHIISHDTFTLPFKCAPNAYNTLKLSTNAINWSLCHFVLMYRTVPYPCIHSKSHETYPHVKWEVSWFWNELFSTSVGAVQLKYLMSFEIIWWELLIKYLTMKRTYFLFTAQ